MGKGGKKRRLEDKGSSARIDLFSHVTGLGDSNEESLEDCLAELQQQSSTTTTPSHSTPSKSLKEAAISSASHSKLKIDSGHKSSIVSSAIVESWNRSFLDWVKRGTYTPGLLPCIDEEMTRNFKVKELSSFLLESGKDVRMPVFERWWLDSKFEERAHAHHQRNDPVVPLAKSSSEASERLVEELCHHGVSRDSSKQTVQELCLRTNVVAQHLSSQAQHHKSQTPLKKGDRIEFEDHETSITLLYSRKSWKKPFCVKLNKKHYVELEERFLHIHNKATTQISLSLNKSSNDKARHAFHLILLALLLRYSSLSGGQLLQDLRGGGMQGAIHEQVFDALRSHIDGTWMEGFASPFNVYLPTFASAFPDLDWHFGSVGSFMDYSFVEGCCEVNPPFSPGIMDGMMDKIEEQLARADEYGAALTFAVVVPTFNRASSSETAAVKQSAAASFRRMLSEPLCRHHVVLTAREHGYVEGSQHLRPTRYKQSSYDTSVIILQSSEARKLELNIAKFEEDLKSAFASRHAEELSQRKKDTAGD
jgi:phosphorylated CTD-interacting factor 1